MNERRIARLTREVARQGRRPVAWKPMDDERLEHLVRLVAIVVLVLLVFTFATWPRDGDAERPPARAEQPVASHAAPGWDTVAEGGVRIGMREYSPLY